ncbi:DUF421 domain-containing protein [Bacillus sp. FJAT-42376]|uniref:DUF421 domain-containing protein n=1 Tax=Bacillus sp. FJAT-42376 TaxID=2014076 RepID=UPI000F50C34B|nr:DUF421 domain-containing protein [Bacillus sp. FJAT-42376]AZB41060.1 DUF421 domain-containing protein [Bacillus sp. FJAT-42376]
MDFYLAQETLSIMEWVLRSVIGFVFLVIVAKVLGQRTISQLRLLDFVIALVIGNIIAHPLSDHHLGMKGSIVSTIVLVVLYSLGIQLTLKSPGFRRFISHKSVTVVENGDILVQGLKKARISMDVLLEELREEKVDDVKKVALAIWEADGKMSVFLHPEYEPVTPVSLQLKTEPFNFPRTIIMEGRVLSEVLNQLHKEESWVVSRLESLYHTEVQHVLLGTLDGKDQLKVFLYK